MLLAFGRPGTAGERERLAKFVEHQTQVHSRTLGKGTQTEMRLAGSDRPMSHAAECE